jgi:hypothetical protein
MQEIRGEDKTQVQEALVSWYKFQDTQVLHQLRDGSHRKQKIFGQTLIDTRSDQVP